MNIQPQNLTPWLFFFLIPQAGLAVAFALILRTDTRWIERHRAEYRGRFHRPVTIGTATLFFFVQSVLALLAAASWKAVGASAPWLPWVLYGFGYVASALLYWRAYVELPPLAQEDACRPS